MKATVSISKKTPAQGNGRVISSRRGTNRSHCNPTVVRCQTGGDGIFRISGTRTVDAMPLCRVYLMAAFR